MKISINLLQETQKIQTKIKRLGLLLQTISIVVLAVFGVIVFLVFSYSLFLTSRQNKLAEDISENKTKIEEMKPIESKYSLVYQKLMSIDKAINTHEINNQEAIDYYNFSRERVRLKDVSLKENSNEIKISLETDNVAYLVRFFEELVDFSSMEVDAIRIEGISYGQDSGYKVDLVCVLKEADGS